MRTTHQLVTFANAFYLRSVDSVLPAGTYKIDTDEELIEGLSFLAYRRTATWIHLPAVGTRSGSSQMILIQPDELDVADRKPDEPAAKL
jgi:hypothetical protein